MAYKESPFNKEQLEKIFGFEKLKKKKIKQSFFIDVAVKKQCDEVFSWIASKIQQREKRLLQEMKPKKKGADAAAEQDED